MVVGKDDVISIVDVTKTFRTGVWKRKIAVENLNLSVPRGEVVGLLGPNGSGKSTTLKMILGFLKPTTGQILVCGYSADERRARSYLGYLPENPRFQRFLTANEILSYYGKLLKLSGVSLRNRMAELLELVGLKHAAEERVQGFSKGMTQRLAIAQSLLNKPSLLIFDEPMSGLDPLGRMEIRKLITKIHTEMPETTIFFSTHILGDIEELCSWVALLRKGHLTTYCNIEELLAGDSERFDVVITNVSKDLTSKLLTNKRTKQTASGLSVDIQGTENLISQLTELRAAGAKVVTVATQRRNLEEALFSEQAIASRPASLENQTGVTL